VFDWGLLLFFFGGVSTVFWVFFVGFEFLGVVGVLVLVGFVGFFLWAS
jgi:NADH:ubiquinone oxidoreductase subunit 6 (subunit J)